MRQHFLLNGFQFLNPALHLLNIRPHHLMLRRRQRRFGATVFIGITAAIQIGLGQRLSIFRLLGRFGIHQNDVERLFAHGTAGFRKFEMQGEHDAMQEKGNTDAPGKRRHHRERCPERRPQPFQQY